MDAPSPEEKLTWLSDIAQAHYEEWDAYAAALEMLPAEKQAGFRLPGSGSGFKAGFLGGNAPGFCGGGSG